jgi:hypothetical protein
LIKYLLAYYANRGYLPYPVFLTAIGKRLSNVGKVCKREAITDGIYLFV